MKVELYTSSYCPFCVAAVNLLEARGIEHVNHVMDSDPGGLRAVKARYGHNTVPIIVVDGEFIGGNDDLMVLDAAGKLAN